ncbi:acyl carrier protein [Salmonella enterica subsp. houtenae]|uniref:Acyl carrier protein n=11 Tax=Salmonella enterica TaxID=28901 RepID=A0A3V3VI61_SALHO|nr:acyl carrier protein [Salmonella enterica]EAA7382766.1 acyl carrier protein [Salmonella enterica subsp. enterica]EBH8334633.1 acyl carrier protein [Salmonella enterica subsp. houtenae serovar Houten]EBI0040554.1 acyl carrier protein [Salmonella enterica subsp. diarizonae serovar 61:k:z35]EBI0350730.1 acyl carrier protein [Salmonella enterica subsp. arizonae serovar 48:z4,z23,z32:-]ECM3644356.1 acyl carrier protein [Salmonella enterica subsp. enterica serovar Typhimurium]EDG3663984.1 acyl c
MNNFQDVWTNIVNLIADVKDVAVDDLSAETMLRTLELDSLDYVEMMVTIKRNYGITLEAELFINNPDITLGELCQHICE